MASKKFTTFGSLDINKQDEKKTSGANLSYWLESTSPITFTPLNDNISCDVVIVGGGLAGVTTAYLLSKGNYSVVLLEDGNIGSGETGRTTAHIVNALDDRYYEVDKICGEESARLASDSHTQAINFIGKVVDEENIDCDYERLDGYLFLHPSDDKKTLQDEYQATNRAGIGTELTDSVPGIKLNDNYALKFPNQAQFHPLKYLSGLCSAIISNGGKIFTGTHVTEVEETGVKTKNGFTVNAQSIVVATNTPINNRVVIHTKQAPYRTYVIAARVPKGVLPKALWWDTGDHNSEWPTYPYHYVRLSSIDDKYDLLIAGGEDHKTAQPDEEEINEEERYNNLVKWTKEHFPMIEEVIYRWSGQVMEPVDHLGFIGNNPLDAPNIYVATGDSGNGMTHCTIAGIIITDLIGGKENKWSKIYDPSRKSLSTIDTFVEEQINVAKQYLDYLTPGDIDSVKELKMGEGAIIRDNLNKVAVYKDGHGKLHAFSAVCPHLKCIIQWNSDEKTFDCPCHGSRFSALGKVINGPANVDLEKVGVPE